MVALESHRRASDNHRVGTDERPDEGLDLLDTEPRRAEPQRKRRRGFVLLVTALVALGLVLALVVFIAFRGLAILNTIQREPGLTPDDYAGRPTAATADAGKKPPLNFVLMGSDTRGNERGRSDSLMVAHVSGDREHVYLVSYPRDLWVQIPGYQKGKINWAYSYGGAKLTVRTLEELSSLRMDHAVVIDFEGFIKLTDVLGGVTVYNPWTTEQKAGVRFEQGDVTLSGERALIYVRERYQLPNGDLDRAYRQRTVLKAILAKIMSKGTLTNPILLSDVLGKVSETMTVDSEMTNSYVIDLALSMRLEGAESVRLLQAPIKGFATVGDQSVDVIDQAGMAELHEAMRTDAMAAYYDKHKSDTPDKLGQVEPPR